MTKKELEIENAKLKRKIKRLEKKLGIKPKVIYESAPLSCQAQRIVNILNERHGDPDYVDNSRFTGIRADSW